MLRTSGRITLSDGTGERLPVLAAVVPVGARHQLRGLLSGCLMIYLEPDSTTGRAMTQRLDETGLDPRAARSWVQAAAPVWQLGRQLPDGGPRAIADAVVRELLGCEAPVAPPSLHPVLQHALGVLPQLLPGVVRIQDLAAVVAYSPGRLGRLFADELGLSFPAYLRWLRMRRAIERVRSGDTLTDAAHAAGFTDSAHFNRVFNQMFGLSPRLVARGVEWG
ncbi:MAG: helix-turn-helix transcriptional regulator [Catenulispora sp.]|nr:helix-turn-helix transcriptional regulator [Catenulispora sp.]